MSDTLLTDPVAAATTEPAPETEKAPRRPRALQSRRASERLEYYAEWMHRLATDETLRTQLAALGYDDAKLAQGVALFNIAQTAYHTRQQTLTAYVGARNTADGAYQDALLAFRNFRTVALVAIDDPAIRTAVAAEQRLPHDRQEFISVARAAYNTVLAEPRFVDTLELHSYTPEKIQNAAAMLDALSLALVARKAARQTAASALRDRNTALTAMGDWVQRLGRIAVVAARSQANPAP